MSKGNYLVCLLIVFTNGGCSLGFVPTNLKVSKTNLEYMEKLGMTHESRLRDSAQCGGGGSMYPGFTPQNIKDAQRDKETDLQTYGRLYGDWYRCMLEKGYHSTEY